MPYYGTWGTFIHIPKTGGTFVREVLRCMGTRESNKNINQNQRVHDLPIYWRDGEVWTSVREPCEWLASVWAHRVRTNWERYPHLVPWHYLMDIFTEYETDKWEEFCENITRDMPGIIGWFYGIYTPPMVKSYILGPDLYQKLREIGGDPDIEETKRNKGKNVPIVTDEQRMMVYNAEGECYERYGFDAPF